MNHPGTVTAIVAIMTSIGLCTVARAGEGNAAAPDYRFHFDWTSSNEAIWRTRISRASLENPVFKGWRSAASRAGPPSGSPRTYSRILRLT